MMHVGTVGTEKKKFDTQEFIAFCALWKEYEKDPTASKTEAEIKSEVKSVHDSLHDDKNKELWNLCSTEVNHLYTEIENIDKIFTSHGVKNVLSTGFPDIGGWLAGTVGGVQKVVGDVAGGVMNKAQTVKTWATTWLNTPPENRTKIMQICKDLLYRANNFKIAMDALQLTDKAKRYGTAFHLVLLKIVKYISNTCQSVNTALDAAAPVAAPGGGPPSGATGPPIPPPVAARPSLIPQEIKGLEPFMSPDVDMLDAMPDAKPQANAFKIVNASALKTKAPSIPNKREAKKARKSDSP